MIFSPSLVRAEEGIPDRAQKIIDHCWDVSSADRESVSNETIRAGHWKTTRCLEAEIVKLAEAEMFPHDPEAVTDTKQQLKTIRDDTVRLYWNIYNNQKGCELLGAISCGTMFHILPNQEAAHAMEKILINSIRMIELHH